MKERQINLKPLFGSQLDSRQDASALFEEVKQACPECADILLNFDGISFMSRSFADQFCMEKQKLTTFHNYLIKISNADISIMQMFKAVNCAKKSTDRTFEDIPVYTFTKQEELSKYLEAL
jgi:hypothetical protein